MAPKAHGLTSAPPAPHRLGVAAMVKAFETDAERGLCASEAQARLASSGPNELVEAPRRGPLAMLAAQFADFMIVVLIAAAVVSGAVGEVADAIAILVIVLLNAVIGFVQEYRAEQAVAALRKIAALSARVVRDGEVADIAARELVPGDLVVLEAGNIVPADIRLVDTARLRVEEAALTGESQPVEKGTEALDAPDLPLGDRHNMAFKGTVATYGRGRGVVVATGMRTELGRIATLLSAGEESRTPLQRRLSAFGRRLALAVLLVCALIFAAGLARGEAPVLMFLTAVSLAVAAIPEALPAVITVALALGARRMVANDALIRRLPAVETLGSVTFICSDKTGTLTRNRMHVASLHASGRTLVDARDADRSEAWRLLLAAMALNNDTRFGRQGKPVGDPTEVAIFVAANEALGFDTAGSRSDAPEHAAAQALAAAHPRIAELPFDSERKRMTTLHASGERSGGALLAFTKGAPESVLPCCTTQLVGDRPAPLEAQAIFAEAERLAAAGQRVLAFAYRAWPRGETLAEDAESDLCFLGLVGLIDPPRREAAEAVRTCRAAGIVPVMITGDHPATARAIAREIGIVGDGATVLTGRDLLHMPDAELAARATEVRVYARVDPEQKIRIVEALKQRGEIVAMTGDGVNDAPALARADIGVAMGRIGTDVAREASDMVLLDDNFATIVGAVREGRRIYDNIRKFIRFVMTGNAGEIWTLALAPFLGMPLPLLPIQILWVNLVTDGLPGLALSAEPAERGAMRRPPRPPGESVFAGGVWQHIVWVGVLIGGVSLAAQALGLSAGSSAWQTMVFTVLAFAQLMHVVVIRSDSESIVTLGLLSNRPLIGAVALSVALHLAIVYVPWLQAVFKTQPLSAAELAVCVGLAAAVPAGVEAEKWLKRQGWIYREKRGAGVPVTPR
jgi:Ca2+-transporting ATPase